MELKDIQDVLKLKEEDIDKLQFRELLEIVEFIKSKFLSSELEIEKQMQLYSKAITLLMKAREKLSLIKKEKEEIDRKYEEFIKNIEE
ncbi:MAG: exodeoxyribonuclease VII [Fervidobacterium sp.]|nr:exodeoxyribonuclease VII [Fervidobacterium sp.]